MPIIPDYLRRESLLPNETPAEVHPSLLPYDPHVHRGNEEGPTNLETLVHLLKGSLGLGILAMPNAYMHAGLVVGTIALALIGFLCAYSLYILISTQYLMCTTLQIPVLNYRQSMEICLRNGPRHLKCFSRLGGALVDTFLVIFQFGLCLAYTIYCAAAIKQVITLENTMRNPAAFIRLSGVLNQGIIFAVLLYFFVGFFGYWKYGDETLASITLNLPENDLLAQITKILYAIAMILSHPLQHFPAFDIIWGHCFDQKFKYYSKTRIRCYKIIQRTVTIIMITLVACAYPELDKVISFIGSFCLSMVGICFPAVIQYCVLYPDNYGRYYWKLVQDIIIFIIGILAFIIGISNSIYNL